MCHNSEILSKIITTVLSDATSAVEITVGGASFLKMPYGCPTESKSSESYDSTRTHTQHKNLRETYRLGKCNGQEKPLHTLAGIGPFIMRF